MVTEPTNNLKKINFSLVFPPDIDITFGEYTYVAGARFGPLRGPQIEIFHLRAGQVEIICDGAVTTLQAPRMAIIAASESLEYRYGTDVPCHVAWCQWVSDGQMGDAVVQIRPLVGVMAASPDAVVLMQLGTKVAARPDHDTAAYSKALTRALLEEILIRKRLELSARAIPLPVTRARSHIERNHAKPVSMSELAEVSGLSPQHLNKLFQTTYGENALDYLWRVRTRQGAFLLTHTGLRISQIAYQCGFQTPNHFSRRIRERFGVSPRDYRTSRWKRLNPKT